MTFERGKRGGARAGAGRKPVLTDLQRPAIGAAIDRRLWRRTRAAFVRSVDARFADDDLRSLWNGLEVLRRNRRKVDPDVLARHFADIEAEIEEAACGASAPSAVRPESHPASVGLSSAVWRVRPPACGGCRFRSARPSAAWRNIGRSGPGPTPSWPARFDFGARGDTPRTVEEIIAMGEREGWWDGVH